MGFFGKLFGGGGERPSDNTGGPGGMGMLRTARSGGYDKTATLTAIDALTSEIMLLKEAVEAKEKGEPFRVPHGGKFEMPPTVRAGGFNEQDTEEYIASLQAEIEKLRLSIHNS